MSNPARHAGRVTEDGALMLRDRSAWMRAIQRQKGRAVWLSVQRVQERPTQDQHGYYRAVVLPLLAEEWGWGNQAELHHRLKEEHLPAIVSSEEWRLRKVGSKWVKEPPSCADLTKEQFAAFLQAVLDQAADAQIAVPPPRGSEAA